MSSAAAGRERLSVLADDLDHPECVAVGPGGDLWAGGEAGQLYRIDPLDGIVEQVADVGCLLLGLCLDARGNVYACAPSRHAVLVIDPRTGSAETYCDGASGAPLRLPNHLCFDEAGALLVTDSGSAEPGAADGTIVRVTPGGGNAEVLALPAMAFPNGVAFDGRDVLVAESFGPAVLRIADLDRVTARVALDRCVPDGIAIDADGGIWSAIYQPNQVRRWDPDGGGGTVVLDDWAGRTLLCPTNLCFFGPERDRLAISSLACRTLLVADVGRAGRSLQFPDKDARLGT